MNPKKLSPFTLAIHAKGWRAVEVGKRWGIQSRQMSRICKTPSQRDWDALEGLPRKSNEG